MLNIIPFIFVIDKIASKIPCVPKPEFLTPLNGKISGPLDEDLLILTVPHSNFKAIDSANSILLVKIDACNPYSELF